MPQLEEYQQIIVPVLKRYFIKRAFVFGSLAKREMKDDSDVDLLIEAETGFTLFNMLKLEQEISDLVNRKVDLVEYGALKAFIKNEVLQTAISIL